VCTDIFVDSLPQSAPQTVLSTLHVAPPKCTLSVCRTAAVSDRR
jgi:hypothetical protein